MEIKKIFKALVVALGLSLVLTGIFSVFVYFINMSERTVSVVIFVLSAVSVLFGAYILARKISEKGLLNGFVLSVFYLSVIFLISLAANGNVSFESGNVLRIIGCVLSGMLGGVLGINMKST